MATDTTWLAQLQPASFRYRSFQVDSSEIVSGTDVVVREYPFGDLPTVFPMGTATERIKLSAYVVGPDYAIQRDALREVLSGPGTLVHPTYGAIKVFVAGPYTMREAPLREGCVVRFDLEFVRAEERQSVSELANTQADAILAATAAREAAQDKFAAEFSIKGVASWVQDNVVSRITESVDGVMGEINQATGLVTDVNDAIAGTYQVLRNGLTDLVAAPASLAGSVRDLFALPAQLEDSTLSALRGAYQDLFGLSATFSRPAFEQVIAANPDTGQLATMGLGVVLTTTTPTSSRVALDALDAATAKLFDTLAVASWVEAMATAEVESYEQSVQWRSLLYTRCTDLLARDSAGTGSAAAAADSSFHDAVLALLTAGLADLKARGRDQTRLTTTTPHAWTNIWSLSYELYGTAGWADEIMDMNPSLTHPMLVPPGQALTVVRHE